MKTKITTKEIIDWVLENKDNTTEMDLVSHIIFPYTTKYKSRYGEGHYEPNIDVKT